MKIDLHCYRPKDLKNDGLAKIIQQAWETGAEKLCLIHGHGRSRGRSPGFVNTRTGRFGLIIRGQLRRSRGLRQWIKYTTLDCRSWGATTVKLKANPAPSRSELDWSILPTPSFPERQAAREERKLARELAYGPWLPRRLREKNQQFQQLGPELKATAPAAG